MSWTAKQHLWKSKAKEGHHLSCGGQSNRQKKWYKNCVTRYVVSCSVNLKIKLQAKTTGPKYRKYLRFRKKRNILGLGYFLYTCECDDERACYLIIKKYVYSKTKYANIPSFHSSHHFNSPLKLKFRQSSYVIWRKVVWKGLRMNKRGIQGLARTPVFIKMK